MEPGGQSGRASSTAAVAASRIPRRYATFSAALFPLSTPRQFPAAGVSVYCQLPDGTLVSVQVRTETMPEQFA